jgi:hypothetical protein
MQIVAAWTVRKLKTEKTSTPFCLPWWSQQKRQSWTLVRHPGHKTSVAGAWPLPKYETRCRGSSSAPPMPDLGDHQRVTKSEKHGLVDHTAVQISVLVALKHNWNAFLSTQNRTTATIIIWERANFLTCRWALRALVLLFSYTKNGFIQ